MQEEVGEVSLEEAALLSRVTNHDIVTKAEILTTAKILMQEAEQLDQGEYQLLDICHLFLDCSDRACEQVRARDLANEGTRLMRAQDVGPFHGRQVFEGNAQSSHEQEHVAHMAWGDKSEHEPLMQEYQTTKLRVVDPIADEGVWVVRERGR